jgi:hypothetical protein
MHLQHKWARDLLIEGGGEEAGDPEGHPRLEEFQDLFRHARPTETPALAREAQQAVRAGPPDYAERVDGPDQRHGRRKEARVVKPDRFVEDGAELERVERRHILEPLARGPDVLRDSRHLLQRGRLRPPGLHLLLQPPGEVLGGGGREGVAAGVEREKGAQRVEEVVEGARGRRLGVDAVELLVVGLGKALRRPVTLPQLIRSNRLLVRR